MVARPRLRRILATLALYLGASAAIAYFGFHAWNGEHGLQAQRRFEAEEERLKADLAAIRAERGEWEKRVALLKPESLDPDMLDERARELLLWAHPNDLILLRRP